MPYLYTRDLGDGYWSGGGARWAFFAIFIVLIIIVVLGTLRINRKRSQQGLQPIHGTRWMTPPSYMQSQRNQMQQRGDVEGGTFVPTYTENANENDMGFYDRYGAFHPTTKNNSMAMGAPSAGNIGPEFTGLGSTAISPQAGEEMTTFQNGIVPPDTVHRRNTSNLNGVPISNDQFQPPDVPPPDIHHPSYNIGDDNSDIFREHDFFRPSGPPPGRSDGAGNSDLRSSSSNSEETAISTTKNEKPPKT